MSDEEVTSTPFEEAFPLARQQPQPGTGPAESSTPSQAPETTTASQFVGLEPSRDIPAFELPLLYKATEYQLATVEQTHQRLDQFISTLKYRPGGFSEDLIICLKSGVSVYLMCAFLSEFELSNKMWNEFGEKFQEDDTRHVSYFDDEVAANVVKEYNSLHATSLSPCCRRITCAALGLERKNYDVALMTDHEYVEREQLDVDQMLVMCHWANYTLDDVDRSTLVDLLIWLYTKFEEYSKNIGFLAGRGSKTISEVWGETTGFSVSSGDEETNACAYILSKFLIYPHDFPTINKSFFGSITQKIGNHLHYARDIAWTACQLLFGHAPTISSVVEESVDQMVQTLRGSPFRGKIVQNIKRGLLSDKYCQHTHVEETLSLSKVGAFLRFISEHVLDSDYDVNVGRTSDVIPLAPVVRKTQDDFAFKLISLAHLIYVKIFDEGSVIQPRSYDLRKFQYDLLNHDNKMIGRSTGVENVKAEFYSNYWDTGKDDVITRLMVDESSWDELRSIAALMEPSGPSNYPVLHGDGLTYTQSEVEALEENLQQSHIEIQEREEYITQVTGHAYEPQLEMGSYTNWTPTPQLISFSMGAWAKPNTLFERISDLMLLGFKYDVNRDRAREILEDAFPMTSVVGQHTRFPESEILVCRDDNIISTAITDIIAALNYKIEEPKPGVTPRPQAEQQHQGRTPSTYSDASLNYTKALGTLRDAVARNSYDRSKFESIHGLRWSA